MSADVRGLNVTLTSGGTRRAISAGGAIRLTLPGAMNMRHVGSTGVWPLIRTALSNGTAIDEASSEFNAGLRAAAVAIGPGRFARAPSIAPLDPRAGAYTSLQLNFTSSNFVDANGTLQLTLPGGVTSDFTAVDATVPVVLRHDDVVDAVGSVGFNLMGKNRTTLHLHHAQWPVVRVGTELSSPSRCHDDRSHDDAPSDSSDEGTFRPSFNTRVNPILAT